MHVPGSSAASSGTQRIVTLSDLSFRPSRAIRQNANTPGRLHRGVIILAKELLELLPTIDFTVALDGLGAIEHAC
jgi:hypothetical protein